MEFDQVNQNRDVAEFLQALLVNYEQQGGCNAYSMQSLRREFAVYVPFTHPEFHRHFSAFALQAIDIDRRYNRWCYPVGGQPPPANVPIEQTLPFIYPPQAGQAPTNNAPGGHIPEQWGPADIFLHQNAGMDNQHSNPRFDAPEPALGTGGDAPRRHKNKRKRRSRSHRRSSSSSSGSSDNSVVYSFVPRDTEVLRVAPPECQAIMRYRDEYKSNTLKRAVDSFVWRSNKPHEFPNALVWDLLQYNYIDLEKVNAGVIPDVSELFVKSLDKDAASKIKARPFTESGEWRNAISILRKSLSIAFPKAADSFKKYARHVKSLEVIFTRRIGLVISLPPFSVWSAAVQACLPCPCAPGPPPPISKFLSLMKGSEGGGPVFSLSPIRPSMSIVSHIPFGFSPVYTCLYREIGEISYLRRRDAEGVRDQATPILRRFREQRARSRQGHGMAFSSAFSGGPRPAGQLFEAAWRTPKVFPHEPVVSLQDQAIEPPPSEPTGVRGLECGEVPRPS